MNHYLDGTPVARTSQALPKLRTVSDTIDEIKRLDPSTAITTYFIRELLRAGKIKALSVGTKQLIYWETVIDYLQRRGA